MGSVSLLDEIVHYDNAVERHRKGLDALNEIKIWLRMNRDVKRIEALHIRLEAEIHVAQEEFASAHVRLQRKLTEVEL